MRPVRQGLHAAAVQLTVLLGQMPDARLPRAAWRYSKRYRTQWFMISENTKSLAFIVRITQRWTLGSRVFNSWQSRDRDSRRSTLDHPNHQILFRLRPRRLPARQSLSDRQQPSPGRSNNSKPAVEAILIIASCCPERAIAAYSV
jgi:hypothetical protein